MGNHTRIGVDVAKAVFEVAISDRPGHAARRERLHRAEFLPPDPLRNILSLGRDRAVGSKRRGDEADEANKRSPLDS